MTSSSFVYVFSYLVSPATLFFTFPFASVTCFPRFAALSSSCVPFEVLNNERAELRVKLMGKSRLKQCSAAHSCPGDYRETRRG